MRKYLDKQKFQKPKFWAKRHNKLFSITVPLTIVTFSWGQKGVTIWVRVTIWVFVTIRLIVTIWVYLSKCDYLGDCDYLDLFGRLCLFGSIFPKSFSYPNSHMFVRAKRVLSLGKVDFLSFEIFYISKISLAGYQPDFL